MSDPAIIEAAVNSLPFFWHDDDKLGTARSVVGAVTPLIEAAALERAAKAIETEEEDYLMRGEVAAAIRALITGNGN